jgi:hypothetical protein
MIDVYTSPFSDLLKRAHKRRDDYFDMNIRYTYINIHRYVYVHKYKYVIYKYTYINTYR